MRELIRRGAEIALNARPEWLDELDHATAAANPAMADDPELAAAASRSTRANLLQWASANVGDPGAPVPGNVGVEPLTIARDLVRRGLDQYALDAYRVGQNVAWRLWMDIAFTLTDDKDELRELLNITARSISAFVDATMAGINEQMQRERDELTSGSQAERREVVALILDGAPISRQRAESRLGYRLDCDHTAAVVWSERPEADPRELDRVAEALGHSAGNRPLSVMASTATRWVWIPGRCAPTADSLRAVLGAHPNVRVVLGSTAHGMDGFRRSHLDALTTQQMLGRLHSRQQIASFDDVELVALFTVDGDGADAFLRRTLGDLAAAPEELRDTVLTFVAEQQNVSRAAERLYLHRNTLMRRLAQAQQLLPSPLTTNGIRVAVALEVLRWQGQGLR
jgi:DNA-binding PucR family transcriptional regulator